MSFATTITPIGLLSDRLGQQINVADYALKPTTYIGQRPLTVAVVGTSMNGKTTTAAHLIKGLVASGLKVGAAKVTGTGAGGDIWLMRDVGANPVLDFTDAGPSTYRVSPKQVQEIMDTLISHLAAEGVEAIVLEVADGLFQDETSRLVSFLHFRQAIDGVLFATGSGLGAVAGMEWLRQYHVPIIGISGIVSASLLAIREAEKATKLAVFDLEMLREQAINLVPTLPPVKAVLSI